MKKIAIACLTIILGTGAIAGESKNILKNGGFEELDKKGNIAAWGVSDWNPKELNGKITIKQTDDAASGKKAALIESEAGKGNLLIHQAFKKPAGVEKKYKVTLKFKGAAGGNVNTSFYATAPKEKKLKVQYDHSARIKGSDKWQDLTAEYTIKPDYNQVQLYVRFNKTPVIIDDVEVVEVK